MKFKKDEMWQEAVVQLSGLEWVVVRPAIMTNGPRTSCSKAVTDLAGFSASNLSRAAVPEFLLH